MIKRFCLVVLSALAAFPAAAQFAPGLLTASDLNNAFALKADQSALTAGLAAKANIASPTFTGTVTIPSLVVSGAASLPLFAITSALGFTPANKAGDTFTGPVTIPFTQSGAGAVARTIDSKLKDIVHARDYGVKCDGATDDAAALNAAVAALPQASTIELPAGTCVFKSTLTFNLVNASIVGQGRGATQLYYNGASTTIDLVKIGNGSAGVLNANLSGVTITSATHMTAGSAIHVQKAAFVNLRDVETPLFQTTTNNLWNGLWIDQPDMVAVESFYFTGQNDALRVSAKGIPTNWQWDVSIHNGKLGNSAAGLHVGGGVDNVRLDMVEITTNTINVLIDNDIELFKNQEVYLGPTVITDQGSNYNYYINDTLCNRTNYGVISINGAVTGAHAFDGIYVKAWPNCQLQINSPLIAMNARDGVRIADTSALVTIAASTHISDNLGYGINAEFAYGNLLASGQVYANTAGQYAASVSINKLGGVDQAPVIASGFGTSPLVGQPNGTRAFLVIIGTGGAASTGTLTMPASSSNGWNCSANNAVTFSPSVFVTRQTGNTANSVTLTNYDSSGLAAAWVAGDVLAVTCAPR